MALQPSIPGGCPILNTAIEVDDTDDEFRQLTQSSVEEIISILENILEEGKTTGHFKPSIVSRKKAQYLFASVEGAIMVNSVTKNKQTFREIFDKAIAYFEDKKVKN